MAVYYRSDELVINNRAMVELLSAQQFNLADLSGVHVVRRDVDHSPRATIRAATGLLALAASAGLLLESPLGWAATAVAIIMALGIGGAARLLRQARWNLQADYRGVGVCLYSTTDAHAFGQVRRGLIRALEANARR